MLVRKVFKYRLKIKDKTIEAKLQQTAGCVRFVWNKALALQKERLDNKQYTLNYNKLAGELKNWKGQADTAWLNDVHSQPLQQKLKDLAKALKEAFQKTNPKQFPRFKKKGQHASFRQPQGFKINGNRVYLPKIGWVLMFKSRDIEGTAKNITVSRKCCNWYVSIQTEQEVLKPIHPAKSMIGIDMGVARFATLSDGRYIEPLSSFKKLEKKLAKLQRQLARKVKFSSNWKKQKQKISKLHIRIADARVDFLHKVSTNISKNHAMIVVEDLKIKNMSASAKGTKDNPGRNIKAKAGLNKRILDQGWYEFRRQLEYKQLWRGGQLLAVPPAYTSQRCSSCGHKAKENRKSQAVFNCVACGHSSNADLNAAKNILRAGHALLACGDTSPVVRASAQEPLAA
ncbi:MAG: transposase [Deltaproteobacteria bacterium]|nr:transposase [Deltaproteobacteria bacterium]